MLNLAISYAFSNEKDKNGQIDKDFLRGYLNPLAQELKEREEVGEVFHSLSLEFDNRLEEEIRADTKMTYDEKYDRGLQECRQAFVDNQTRAIVFVLKYPLNHTKEDNMDPVPSKGMLGELDFAHEQNIPKIVLLQDGVEVYEYVKAYTENAIVITFMSLKTMVDEIRRSNELEKMLLGIRKEKN